MKIGPKIAIGIRRFYFFENMTPFLSCDRPPLHEWKILKASTVQRPLDNFLNIDINVPSDTDVCYRDQKSHISTVYSHIIVELLPALSILSADHVERWCAFFSSLTSNLFELIHRQLRANYHQIVDNRLVRVSIGVEIIGVSWTLLLSFIKHRFFCLCQSLAICSLPPYIPNFLCGFSRKCVKTSGIFISMLVTEWFSVDFGWNNDTCN